MKGLLTFLLALLGLSSFSQRNYDFSKIAAPPSGPTIIPSGSLTAFNTVQGTPSGDQMFTFTATNLTGSVTFTAGSGMEVSTNGSTWASTAVYSQSGGNASGTVHNRIAAATTVGNYNSNQVGTSAGATPVNVPYTATVTAQAVSLSVSPGTITNLNSTAGTAGASQSVIVTFANLIGNVNVVPFSPVEVSVDNTNFSNSLSFSTGSPKTIYMRNASTATAGAVGGTVAVSTNGATTQNITVSGTVSPASPTIDSMFVNFAETGSGTGSVTSPAPRFVNNYLVDISGGTPPISSALNFADGTVSTAKIQFDVAQAYADNNTDCSCTWGTPSPFVAGMSRVAIVNNGVADHLTLTGLPTAANGYKVLILASRFTASSRNITFTCQSSSQTIQAQSNVTTYVTLDNLVPTSGTLTITINALEGFWVVNSIIILKKN